MIGQRLQNESDVNLESLSDILTGSIFGDGNNSLIKEPTFLATFLTL